MIPIIDVDEVPSVGLMGRMNSFEDFERRERTNEVLREVFGPSPGQESYFTGRFSRYGDAFRRTVHRHYTSVARTASKLRDSLGLISSENVIRPCMTKRSLRNLPPIMYDYILSIPEIHRLHKLGRVQGYAGISPEYVRPLVKEHKRLIERNGLLRETEDGCSVGWTWKTTDPELSAQQIIDIALTRQYVEELLATTEIDPTDLDEVRG